MRILLFLWCLLLAVPSWAADTIGGRVVGISDGDTITVLTLEKRQVKVRLYGVDCPESKQDYGTRARQFTGNLVAGKAVTVDVMDVDRYGRTVGVVTRQDGTILNCELLKNGLAWVYTSYCKKSFCRDWKNLETEAKRAKVGLWKEKNPVPPWEWRKAARNGTWKGTPSKNTPKVAVVGSYSGNTSSGIFHSSKCRYYGCKRCTAHFSSREAAIQAGYRPCKVCRP